MEPQNYQTKIEVSASAADAFFAIANVNGWWAKTFSGSALATGDTFKVQFGDTWVVFKITEAIPEKKAFGRLLTATCPGSITVLNGQVLLLNG